MTRLFLLITLLGSCGLGSAKSLTLWTNDNLCGLCGWFEQLFHKREDGLLGG